MHQSINMGDQNIGVLLQTLTGICNVVGTLEQNMHHMYQNGTAQFIRSNLNNFPRDHFELRPSTLTAELNGVQQLMEGGGFNTVVGGFKSLTDVTVWVRVKLPSDTPKFEHFIDLDILLARIQQTGLSSEEVWNKEDHSEIVKFLSKKSVVVTSFQRTPPEHWCSSNKNNHLSMMTIFK